MFSLSNGMDIIYRIITVLLTRLLHYGGNRLDLFWILGTLASPCRFLHRSYLSHLGKATNTETHTAYNQRKCSPLENQQNKREHERSVIAVIAFCIH